MAKTNLFKETELAELAKQFREQVGKKRADASRELNVSKSNITMAEENPEQSLTKLRIRIIETYSPYKVTGPLYRLEKK
jgi:DNA-binding XRE family transcriptional regulator